ncbi:MAG: site-specific integrase [Acidobacteria bacterium]|nr:site-specific integrase [Acidobacteriota bacterium]
MRVVARGPFKVSLQGRNGKTRVRWQVKFWHRDPLTDGLKLLARKTFDSKAAATDSIPTIIARYESTRGQVAKGDKLTFRELAESAKLTIYKPAVFIEGRKIDGVKQHRHIHGHLDILSEFFGDMKIANIGPDELIAFKKWRYEKGDLRGKNPGSRKVSLTTINRELAAMRRLMKDAFAKGLVTHDIFRGVKVIDIDAERARNRILSEAEEALLLECCRGERLIPWKRWTGNKTKGGARRGMLTVQRDNEYLKAIILLALDSALRKTEIMKLRWQDIDFTNDQIRVLGEHTKTQTERLVPLSTRTKDELQRLPNQSAAGPVFPFEDFRRSWTTTRKLAGLEDLRFHDLRRTAITRMQMANVPLAIAGKIAGHARTETTAKIYTAADSEIVQTVRDAINAANDRRIQNLEGPAN